jgi:hypothetical protein
VGHWQYRRSLPLSHYLKELVEQDEVSFEKTSEANARKGLSRYSHSSEDWLSVRVFGCYELKVYEACLTPRT